MGMKKSRKKIILILVIVSLLNIAGLFIVPDILESRRVDSQPMVSKGKGKAVLTVPNKELSFHGKGMFNVMEGVQALDNDGKDMTDRVAVTYSSQASMDQKEVHYIVFDSNGEKLEDVATLHLKGYKGPKIQLDPVESVSWQELQHLDEVLVETKKIKADDGFGNDASGAIRYMFKLLPETKSAEVTFSLINAFQDVWTEKMIVQVEDFPEDF